MDITETSYGFYINIGNGAYFQRKGPESASDRALSIGEHVIIELCESELKHKAETDALQAKIDALMLEYCPDEMTEEQIEEYERIQRAVKVNLDD